VSDDLFLTLDQVKELTGAKTKRLVIENLRANGVRHTIKHNGWPAVAFAAVVGTALEARAVKPPRAPWKSNKAA
jgi:hypothetical protein